MTDRFRFRVWDNEFKKYRHGLGIDNGLVCTFDDRSCILEQCTGLRDKNGKLIYEGDIVKKGDNIAEVFWDENCYAIRTRDNRVCWLWNNLYEVIGNIYENADLMEINND